MPSYENQGERTSSVFAGRGQSHASRRIYGESAELFASLIAQSLPHTDRQYVLADIGSFRGELMGEVLRRLPQFRFRTIAVDINSEAMAENQADRKIIADVVNTQLDDKAVDVTLCRYVLQWNPPDKQRSILRELDRISTRAVILQHFGSDGAEREHRKRIDDVLSGSKVPKLRREDYYISSAEEIESWLDLQGMGFTRRAHAKLSNLSDSFVDRYNLAGADSQRLKQVLGDYDYIVVTTWILCPTRLDGFGHSSDEMTTKQVVSVG